MNILHQMKDLLSTQKRLSLNALAQACQAPIDEIEAQILFFQHKGWVREKVLAATGCQSTCQNCSSSSFVVYEWQAL